MGRIGKYKKYSCKSISNSKTFNFLNTYDAINREEIIREFNQGFPNGDLSPRNLWIFKKNEENVSYDSTDFNQRTNIILSDQNQVPFNSTTELSTHVLSNCDQKNFEKTVVIEPVKKNESLSETQKKDYSESNQAKIFAREFMNRGYEIDFERRIGNYLSADLILRKDDKWILCEFKTNAEKISNTVFSQILKYKKELEHIEKDISIELWLVGKGKFRDSLKNEAKKFNIKVIDDSNIHEVLEKEPVYISVPKSIILYGESIIVRIRVDEIKDEPLKLIVKNEIGKIIHEKSFKIQTTDWFEHKITAEGNVWEKAGERFSIIAEYGEHSVLVTIWRSNFGATIELDEKVYTWTDKVYISLVAPDFSNREILEVNISTKQDKILNYKLKQTVEDTEIFTDEIRLSGLKKYFIKEKKYLKDFLGTKNDVGPTNGLLPCGKNDAVQVSFKLSEEETVLASALVRWNIGEVQWLDSAYPVKGKGRIRVVDPDMNLNAYEIDNVEVRIWSDTDALGKSLILHETNVNTGIFEGEINFDPKLSDKSTLKVSEGDTITAEYVDYTLPDPYTSADELNITGTAVIGKKIPSVPKPQFEQRRKKVIRIPKKENLVIIPQGSSVPGCEETDKCYIPSVLEIKLNEEVTWQNKDSAAHTITSGTPKMGPDGEFDSSLFMSGTTFSHRFTKKGEYPYFDITHPWQTGKIIVK